MFDISEFEEDLKEFGFNAYDIDFSNIKPENAHKLCMYIKYLNEENKKTICPNCGNKNAKKYKQVTFPYQDEEYVKTYIVCYDCGYIK